MLMAGFHCSAEYGAAAHYMYKEAGPAADAQCTTAKVSFDESFLTVSAKLRGHSYP
jgi:(p)ppGpp synthase/HD superfamily hydrolase